MKADLSYFNFSKGVIDYVDNIPSVQKIFNEAKFEKVFGPSRQPKSELNQKHKDIAKSLQLVTEELIFGILQRAYELTQSKNICIVNTISNDTSIPADSSAFKVIIRNLLDNAIKFTPEKGVITLSETLTPETVTIEVNDTGVGMDEAKLNSIFDLTNTKRTKGTQGEIGSGIGLSLVKEFVAINKGDITVQSSLNNGTSFYVTFPR